MGTYRTQEFEAALARLSFRRDRTHHNIFWYFDGEKKIALRTRTRQGEKEFDDSLLSLRRKQLGNLSKAQFLELLNGSLSAETYRQHLVTQGIVPTLENEEA